MFKKSKIENEMGKLARESGKLFETGKIKLQLSQLDNEIYNLKAQLGDAVYAVYKLKGLYESSENEQLENLCKKITEIENKKQELQEKADMIQKS